MNHLEQQILTYANAYYQGQELIPDSEYDALVERLKKVKPDSEVLKKVTGSDLKGVSKKYKLPHCMNTLAKCADEKEFKTWWDKHPTEDLMISLKIDGNGQLLEFKNGEFVRSLSRGDGDYGEDTTNNLKKMNFPKTLGENFTGYIRGEVYLKRSVWKKHFSETKNPRNCCAGIVKRLNAEGCEFLSFAAYEVFDDNNIVDKTEKGKFEFLERNGFETAEHKYNISFDDIVKWKNQLDTNGEIPVDGLVIKQNKVDKEDAEKHIPLKAVAFKPNLQTAATKINKIVWQLSGSYLSPVAEVEPVELEGTTVSRATLSNVNIMKDLGVYEGAEVVMSKHGLIIPSIDLVVFPKKDAFTVPTTCPVCGGQIVVNSSGFPECVNALCPRKVGHRFKKMFKVFGIKGCGEVFVKNLEDAGITVEDFLEMCSNNKKDIFNKYAGGVNGEKIYTQMRNIMSGEITPAQFLATFDVKLFDEKKITQLGNLTLDEILSLSKTEILGIQGFAETTATAFLEFISTYKDEISSLREYFTFKKKDDKINDIKKGEEKMKTVCFTGACVYNNEKITRSQLTEKCAGKYQVVDSVTANLDILVCADPNSGSSKLQKAAKNGTKVISYQDFLDGLNG